MRPHIRKARMYLAACISLSRSTRSAVEQTDWHDLAERHFLTEVVRQLDVALANNLVKRFILVAPPRALGMLRPAYSPALRHAISAEIDKDWVALPIHEVEERLLKS